MRLASDGYTIVEVLIVLAVSVGLFVAVIGVFSGKSDSTQFTQAVQDLASKIQNYATQATSGSVPDINGYNCHVGGNNRPIFDSGNGPSDTCIFIGRALLVRTGSASISAYAVSGTRNNSSGKPAETIDQANITTARFGLNNMDLFPDTYNLSDLTILSSKVNGSGGYGLVGLYADLAGTSSPDTNNSSGLLTYGYPFTGTTSSDVQNCVEGSFVNCNAPTANFNRWSLCVQNGGGRTGQIDISATGSGLNTQVNITICT
jgi:type II secretory pathway pseudopilin PulG